MRWNQKLTCALMFWGLSSHLLGQFPNPPFHVTPADPLPHVTATQAALPAGAAPPLSSATWTLIGPAPINGGILYSGRVAGIAADPADANILYIAAAGGGVWKTTNGGASWTPMTDGQQTTAMGAISVAPGDGLYIYAGTGEANNSADSSTDGESSPQPTAERPGRCAQDPPASSPRMG